MDFLNDPEEIWKLKDLVISKTNIADIIGEYTNLESRDTGQFTHRATCPFHSNGQERTPSFYVSATTNSFYCFGCNKSGNVIHFISFIENTPATIALKKLAMRVGLIKEDGSIELTEIPVKEELKSIDPILMEISNMLRNYIRRFIGTETFGKELMWMEKVSFKVDELLEKIGFDDYEYVQEICEKIKKTIKNRLRNK